MNQKKNCEQHLQLLKYLCNTCDCLYLCQKCHDIHEKNHEILQIDYLQENFRKIIGKINKLNQSIDEMKQFILLIRLENYEFHQKKLDQQFDLLLEGKEKFEQFQLQEIQEYNIDNIVQLYFDTLDKIKKIKLVLKNFTQLIDQNNFSHYIFQGQYNAVKFDVSSIDNIAVNLFNYKFLIQLVKTNFLLLNSQQLITKQRIFSYQIFMKQKNSNFLKQINQTDVYHTHRESYQLNSKSKKIIEGIYKFL